MAAASAPASTRPDERRERILAAALDAFNARGVAGASIGEIRIRSGASVGSIYHHFGDKDGIAGALCIEGLADYQRGFLAALAHAATTRAGIEDGVRHHARWVTEHRELARFLLLGRDAGIVASSERPLRSINRRFFAAVSGWTQPRIDAGELQDLPTELMTALWIGPCQELARHWLAGRSRISLTGAAEVLASAAWKSLSRGGDQ